MRMRLEWRVKASEWASELKPGQSVEPEFPKVTGLL